MIVGLLVIVQEDIRNEVRYRITLILLEPPDQTMPQSVDLLFPRFCNPVNSLLLVLFFSVGSLFFVIQSSDS